MPFQKGNKLGSLNKGHPYYPASPDVRKEAGRKTSAKLRGRTMSPEQREKFRAYWESKKGKSHSNGAAISAALKGRKKSPEHVAKVAAANRGKKRPEWSNERHFAWKGDAAHYDSLHDWVARHKGKAKHCTLCDLNDPARRYHWANISGDYLRDLDDWIRVCVPCHSKMDAGRDDLNRVWSKDGNGYVRRPRL